MTSILRNSLAQTLFGNSKSQVPDQEVGCYQNSKAPLIFLSSHPRLLAAWINLFFHSLDPGMLGYLPGHMGNPTSQI